MLCHSYRACSYNQYNLQQMGTVIHYLDVYQLLHASAPSYHPQGVIIIKVYKSKSQYMFAPTYKKD
jgi:hypothetical protein